MGPGGLHPTTLATSNFKFLEQMGFFQALSAGSIVIAFVLAVALLGVGSLVPHGSLPGTACGHGDFITIPLPVGTALPAWEGFKFNSTLGFPGEGMLPHASSSFSAAPGPFPFKFWRVLACTRRMRRAACQNPVAIDRSDAFCDRFSCCDVGRTAPR